MSVALYNIIFLESIVKEVILTYVNHSRALILEGSPFILEQGLKGERSVSTERLKWRPVLRQMWESALRQTLQVRVTSNTQMIQMIFWLAQVTLHVMT